MFRPAAIGGTVQILVQTATAEMQNRGGTSMMKLVFLPLPLRLPKVVNGERFPTSDRRLIPFLRSRHFKEDLYQVWFSSVAALWSYDLHDLADASMVGSVLYTDPAQRLIAAAKGSTAIDDLYMIQIVICPRYERF